MVLLGRCRFRVLILDRYFLPLAFLSMQLYQSQNNLNQFTGDYERKSMVGVLEYWVSVLFCRLIWLFSIIVHFVHVQELQLDPGRVQSLVV